MKSYLFALCLTLSLFFYASNVSAIQSENAGQIRNNIVENTCERVTSRVDANIKRWEGNEPGKHRAYTNAVTNTRKMVSLMKTKGYDTTNLEAALQNLNDAVLKRHTDAQVLVNLLKDTKQYTCGQSEGKFKETMQRVREQWQLVNQDTMEIRNIWQNQVRPEIRKLKEQKPKVTVMPEDSTEE